jgi:hypothetical protein
VATVQLSFSGLTLVDLKPLMNIHDVGVQAYPWTDVSQTSLLPSIRRQVSDIQERISQDCPQLMNKATVWARAIYPLLMLAGQDAVRAWAQVPLKATYPTFEISGVVAGILGKGLAGELEAPYLVVSDRPTLSLESSQEYSGKLETETIVKILQQIVVKNLDRLSQVA